MSLSRLSSHAERGVVTVGMWGRVSKEKLYYIYIIVVIFKLNPVI